MDQPYYRVIPEWFGSGPLPRKELHEATQALEAGHAALVVVGEPTIAVGLERALIRSAKTFKHDLTVADGQPDRGPESGKAVRRR